MKRLSILLLVVMASLSSYALNEKQETAEERGTPSFQPKPLEDKWSKWLVGEWKFLAESDAGTGKGRTKIEFGLNEQFLIMKSEVTLTEITDEQRQYLKETLHASDKDIERYRNSTFKELQIHTINPKTGNVNAYLFDSMRCIAEGRGRREGDKEIIEWKWSAHAQGARSIRTIEKINDNTFTLTHKYVLPNGKKMEDKIEFTRNKTTAAN